MYKLLKFSSVFLVLLVLVASCGNQSRQSEKQPGPETVTRHSFLPDSVSIQTSNVYVYECDNEINNYPIYVLKNQAWMVLPDTTVHLMGKRAASGAKYLSENAAYLYWTKGEEALLEIDDRLLNNCKNLPQEQSWIAAKLRGVDFRALGQEPGWYLEITKGKEIKYVGNYGQDTVYTPVPEPKIDGNNGKTIYDAETESHTLTITINDSPCTDSMSGFEFPSTVSVTVDGTTYNGCGRHFR